MVRPCSLFGVSLFVSLYTNEAAAICLWNCPPSESKVCSDLKSGGLPEPGSGKKFEVISCRKVNGYEAIHMGRQIYTMEIDLVIRGPTSETRTLLAFPFQFVKTENGWR